MLLRCIPPNNNFFNPQVKDLLHSLLFKSSLSTKKLVRLGFTWQLLKKIFLQALKDNKHCAEKRYTMELFSHSLIFMPWYNCDFSEGRMYCFGGFSCLNHRCNLPNSSTEEWWLKTPFPLSLFFSVVGCHSDNVYGGASSWLCSVTLFSHTMNRKGLEQADA